MARLFNIIRRRLLKENRLTRYLIYALGEIVLVVIGILIALNVNNWNSRRNETQEEHAILRNLGLEFSKNKVGLAKVKSDYQGFLASTTTLMDLIGEDEGILLSHNTDSLLSESINYYDYRPTQNVVDELLSSGRLRLIRSDALRLSLFEWSSLMNAKAESWSTLDDFSQNMLMPYLTRNASLKNIDSYGLLKWEDRSRLTDRGHAMFQDIEFENNLDNHAWSLTSYLKTLDKLEACIETIIQETVQAGENTSR